MKNKTQIILCQVFFGLAIILASCSTEKNQHVVITFEKGDDLTQGAIVTLNGLDIGEIESVELNQNYKACALVQIDSDINIPRDSRFILNNESFFSTGIRLEPGKSKSYLKNNDTIQGIRHDSSKQDQIIDVFNDLLGKANFVKHQDSILRELKKLNSHLEKIESAETTN
jgi:ABC-type transporter Mla subunit MlaD